MCRNGLYTERGIKERHGYGADRFRIEPEFAVRIDPALGLLGVLLEPTSVLAKAWDHVERIGSRSKSWRPRSLLVTGAGPIGLLAALMGAERRLEVHVFDRHWSGRKPELIDALGGKRYLSLDAALEGSHPDVVMECTGAEAVIAPLLGRTAPGGIVCLLGVSAPGRTKDLDIGAINRATVLDNDVVFGSVNANRDHYRHAAQALLSADRAWLNGLITRRVPARKMERGTGAPRRRHKDHRRVLADLTIARPGREQPRPFRPSTCAMAAANVERFSARLRARGCDPSASPPAFRAPRDYAPS